MDGDALPIAIASIVLAAGSVGFQVATFLWSGARARAELLVGALGRGGAAVGPPRTAMSREALAAQGFDTPVVAVKVRNKGRMSVNVESVAIRLPVGFEFENIGAAYNPSLPHRLEPQTSETWYFEGQQVVAAASAAVESGRVTAPVAVHGVVDLGNGKRVTTSESLAVPTSADT